MRVIKSITFVVVTIVTFNLSICTIALSNEQKIKLLYEIKSKALTNDFEMLIDEKGLVHILKKDYFTNLSKVKKNIKSYLLSKEDFDQLKNLILEADVFNLKDQYIGSLQLLNCQHESLAITINGRTKEIVISASTLPIQLSRILLKIKEIKNRIDPCL
ncbi:MAG: hypothetical protein NC925_00015 [Candidatus Omnitrophica bacterium]|nr:hypothetical protein [Candidatus Omnitrophota bacterium]MCM8831312.1 hypothetical protein [Candidatus Omnitrophota bacterium]